MFGLIGYGIRGIGFCYWPSLWLIVGLARNRFCRIVGWFLLGCSFLWILCLFFQSSFEIDALLQAIRDSKLDAVMWIMIFSIGQITILKRLIDCSKA